uniref:NudC domain-containing protein 1 n=1 Tax=Anopheles quadriannulatus TaxID=34691 RepID=A0A182X7E4_ANOQN
MPHIELRPDQKLLKPNFDGYKLSLEPVPVLSTEFSPTGHPHRVKTNDCSYYHARLFGMQNHLVRDPWAPGQCYYLDSIGLLQRVCYDSAQGRMLPIAAVYKLPTVASNGSNGEEDAAARYNCSLLFPSEHHCLLSDGCGTVRVLETGDRTTGREWKAQSTLRPVEHNLAQGVLPGGGVLLDGRYVVRDGKRLLHFLTLQLDGQPEAKSKCLLHWHTLEQQQSGPPAWTLCASRTLASNGYPRFCALDYHAAAVLVASDQPYRFVYDSERPVVDPEPKPTESESVEAPAAWEQFPFRWTQTPDEVNVTFDKHKDVQYRVVCEPSSGPNEPSLLQVFANDTVVIDGAQLFAAIDHDSTTWSMDPKLFDIAMRKQQPGVMWPFLFPGAPDEAVPEAGDASRPPPDVDLPPAPNLSAPLEPCDFESGQDTYYTLERLSAADHTVTHTASLGHGPPLFAVTLRAGLPATFATRHDVDACLWQLQPVPLGAEDCRLQHEGTLHAFGYVQASKRQQKYLGCAPDLGYGVVCESHRGVYLYKGSYGASGAGLRNRTGAQVTIGQHQFVSLKDVGEVLGIACENDVLILLAEKAILALQLTAE